MRKFKNRVFNKWAVKIKLTDESLLKVANEIAVGKYEVPLGDADIQETHRKR